MVVFTHVGARHIEDCRVSMPLTIAPLTFMFSIYLVRYVIEVMLEGGGGVKMEKGKHQKIYEKSINQNTVCSCFSPLKHTTQCK